MDTLAAEAFLNASHKVYGLAMRPLSLGHAVVLESLGNPFYHGRLGTPEELRVAAWICANPPLSALRLGGAGNLWWRYRTRNADFEREVARWKVFVDDFCTPPQLWTKAPKAGESRACESYRCARDALIIGKLHALSTITASEIVSGT